jgi:hypothetical protein
MRGVATILGALLAGVYAFYIAAIPIANCTQRSDDPWSLSLVFVLPMGLAAASLLAAARGASSRFIWVTLLPAPLLLLAGWVALPFLWGSTVHGAHVCHVQTGYHEAFPAPWWHRVWAPVHLSVLLVLAWLSVQVWRARAAARVAA